MSHLCTISTILPSLLCSLFCLVTKNKYLHPHETKHLGRILGFDFLTLSGADVDKNWVIKGMNLVALIWLMWCRVDTALMFRSFPCFSNSILLLLQLYLCLMFKLHGEVQWLNMWTPKNTCVVSCHELETLKVHPNEFCFSTNVVLFFEASASDLTRSHFYSVGQSGLMTRNESHRCPPCLAHIWSGNLLWY